MRLRIISNFRGLQVYVLSTSKPLPKGSRRIRIATVSSLLDPPENSKNKELVYDKILL